MTDNQLLRACIADAIENAIECNEDAADLAADAVLAAIEKFGFMIVSPIKNVELQ